MDDKHIYQKIAQLLVDAGPLGAQSIIVRANVFDAGDGGGYEFDYIDDTGELNWFDPDGRAVGDLTDVLVELRDWYVSNNLTAGQLPWVGCLISLHVQSMKIGIEFIYKE